MSIETKIIGQIFCWNARIKSQPKFNSFTQLNDSQPNDFSTRWKFQLDEFFNLLKFIQLTQRKFQLKTWKIRRKCKTCFHLSPLDCRESRMYFWSIAKLNGERFLNLFKVKGLDCLSHLSIVILSAWWLNFYELTNKCDLKLMLCLSIAIKKNKPKLQKHITCLFD